MRTLLIFSFILAIQQTEAAPTQPRPRTIAELQESSDWLFKHDVSVGVEAGGAVYDGDVGGGTAIRTGLESGMSFRAFTEGRLWRFVYAQPGIGFVQKSFGAADHMVTANYIEIPLLVLLKPSQTYYGFRPYFLAGPNLGFNTGNAETETVDFSFDLGIGAERKVWDRLCGFVTFKGSLGMIDVAKGPTDITNMGFQLLLGAKYSL